MTDQRETPASLRRQAEGNTGVRVADRSVPGWAGKRRRAALVSLGGQYFTPETLYAHVAAEAAAARAGGVGGSPPTVTPSREWAPESAESPSAGVRGARCRHPADRPPSLAAPVVGETGEVLPCRFLETTQPKPDPRTLNSGHRKVANALSWNVAHLCQKYGIERVGFLTLTFADHVICAREASRRFNSLATHVLRPRYQHFIRVLERQKSGRIHYHLLVVLRDDIRTGADFDAFAKRDYKSANQLLRVEWAFWRKTAPQYRFGRTELMPIRSDAEAMGQYVGKYIGKHIGARHEEDKGVRLVSYSGDARMATSKHMQLGKYPDQWRAKVTTFARIVTGWKQRTNPHHPPVRCMDDLAFVLGPKWAYHWRGFICDLPPADLRVPF